MLISFWEIVFGGLWRHNFGILCHLDTLQTDNTVGSEDYSEWEFFKKNLTIIKHRIMEL